MAVEVTPAQTPEPEAPESGHSYWLSGFSFEGKPIAPPPALTALPFQQTITRREPYANNEVAYPYNANVRVPLDIYPQIPDEPIREGDFWAEGKPFNHAWAHTSRFVSTRIDSILSVDAWPAEVQRIAKYIRTNIVKTPLGMQHAFVERVNIERAASAPYGSTVALADPGDVSIFDIRGYRTRRY